MKKDFDQDTSIYLQIAKSIEDDILQKVIQEETQVLSTNQLAAMYRINPATAAKGINMLVGEGILYKKRGIGMFVSTGAVRNIRAKRRAVFYDTFIAPLLNEASNLGLSNDQIKDMITKRKKS